MIPQVPTISMANKDTEKILKEVVDVLNTLGQQVFLALQNLDSDSVVFEDGSSLADLLSSGELKGEQGNQGPAGRVYRPSVSAEGIISWILTDEGGTTPISRNIKGPKGDPGEKGEQGAQGTTGDPGPQGEEGAPGVGVPAGGTAGQVLVKKSDSDYNTEWVTL